MNVSIWNVKVDNFQFNEIFNEHSIPAVNIIAFDKMCCFLPHSNVIFTTLQNILPFNVFAYLWMSSQNVISKILPFWTHFSFNNAKFMDIKFTFNKHSIALKYALMTSIVSSTVYECNLQRTKQPTNQQPSISFTLAISILNFTLQCDKKSIGMLCMSQYCNRKAAIVITKMINDRAGVFCLLSCVAVCVCNACVCGISGLENISSN